MIRCETCLVALQIADRENNNCPDCKDYKRKIQLELAIDRFCRLREKRKNIDWQIKDAKNEIRQISPDNVYLDI